jgi:hypothetical protein
MDRAAANWIVESYSADSGWRVGRFRGFGHSGIPKALGGKRQGDNKSPAKAAMLGASLSRTGLYDKKGKWMGLAQSRRRNGWKGNLGRRKCFSSKDASEIGNSCRNRTCR